MRRTLLVLAALLQAACLNYSRDWNDPPPDEDGWGYCDESGCYWCHGNECAPSSDNNNPDGHYPDAGPGHPRPDGGGPRPDGNVPVPDGRVVPDAPVPPTPDASVPPPDASPAGGCTTDQNCAPGESCCDGVCKESRVFDPTLNCTRDGQCGGGECVDGECHAQCGGVSDCGTGDTCQAGICIVDPSPNVYCVFNKDCGGSQTCINGTCHLNCTKDESCPNEMDFCDQGVCRPDWRIVSECTVDSQCTGPDDQCVNGECRQRCMQDAQCELCPDGPRCVGGYCQE